MVGVLHTVLKMFEEGATHLGVATDHVIESFRNRLWPGYKTGVGIDPASLNPRQRTFGPFVDVAPIGTISADHDLDVFVRLTGAGGFGKGGTGTMNLWNPSNDVAGRWKAELATAD